MADPRLRWYHIPIIIGKAAFYLVYETARALLTRRKNK
jgi:hypothetical protein